MRLLEGSDTQLKFHITEKQYENGVVVDETDKDLTEYDSVTLSIKFFDSIKDFEGTIDNWEGGDGNAYVIFDIYSEDTKDKCGKIQAEIWGVKWVQKNRLNSETIEGEVLHSFKIPQWDVTD